MSNIKFVENLVSAFIADDHKKIINELRNELRKAENKNNNVVVKRIKNLINEFPGKKYLNSQNLKFPEPIHSIENPLISKYNSNILMEEVVLNNDIKNAVITFLREWEDFSKLIKHNLYPTNKLLFYGPPGTGKTKLAHAIANKLDFPLIIVRLDELISSFLGKTGKNIREIFQLAEKENVVILLDEIDTIAKHRDDDKELGELKRVVTVLLQNIDIFPNNSVIIGATNHQHLLDRAIWRRFPVKLNIDLPDKENRKLLFKLYLNEFHKKFNINLLAEITENYSGSAINDICAMIKKQYIISGSKNFELLSMFNIIFKHLHDGDIEKKIDKKRIYKMCNQLKGYGYSLKEISSITNVPYTTLRDNIL